MFHADQFTRGQNTAVGRVLAHADAGVTVFFLISGFLLYRPFVAAAFGDAPLASVSLFYWRRLLRIVPGYWVALLVLAPLLSYAHPLGLPNILLVQSYWPRYGDAVSGIPPAWSVSVEISFYLLLPLYASRVAHACYGYPRRKRRRRELSLLAVLATASFALRVAIAHSVQHHQYLLVPLPFTLLWFCAGMALAVISVEPTGAAAPISRLAAQPWLCWALALAAYGATLATARDSAESPAVFIGYAAAATLLLMPIVLRDFQHFAGGRLLHSRGAAWLGLVSYGIYLYHYPIMAHIHLHTGSTLGNLAALAALGVAVAVACGALSYYLVERRALALKSSAAFARVRDSLSRAP
jgi:peptidoglycan/LPS O-acetylase OafA/YrhL